VHIGCFYKKFKIFCAMLLIGHVVFFVHIGCFCKNFKIFCAMLLIRHDLHHTCGLYVIGVFNLFEHYISLEILVFNSYVELERLPCLIHSFHMHTGIGSVRYEI
jgi:hypothetical protein